MELQFARLWSLHSVPLHRFGVPRSGELSLGRCHSSEQTNRSLFRQTAHVNLNHMICPAILDPFQGGNYRLIASLHQAFLCPFVSKFLIYMFGRTDGDGAAADDCNGKAIDNSENHQRRLSLNKPMSAAQIIQQVIGGGDCNDGDQWNAGCDNDNCASTIHAADASPKKSI